MPVDIKTQLRLLNMLRMPPILKRNTKKLADVFYVFQPTQNLVISRGCFEEDGKEMYQELNCTCTAVVLLIKHFSLRNESADLLYHYLQRSMRIFTTIATNLAI